jgi:CheY-like chemotaxis protein
MSTLHATSKSPARRVLVVDDNEDAAESLAALLRIFGHDVSVAFDGEQALALAPEVKPEVVLLDLGMPRMDGREVARRMRAAPWGLSPRIFALSGFGGDDDRARSREAGCDEHLLKPVSPENLQSILSRDLP